MGKITKDFAPPFRNRMMIIPLCSKTNPQIIIIKHVNYLDPKKWGNEKFGDKTLNFTAFHLPILRPRQNVPKWRNHNVHGISRAKNLVPFFHPCSSLLFFFFFSIKRERRSPIRAKSGRGELHSRTCFSNIPVSKLRAKGLECWTLFYDLCYYLSFLINLLGRVTKYTGYRLK